MVFRKAAEQPRHRCPLPPGTSGFPEDVVPGVEAREIGVLPVAE
jgi:hypothetical protein